VTVYLVGAGPGDPELITVKGLRLLASAEVVVHDRLVAPALVDQAPPNAERIDVGKRPGHPYPQEEINGLLVDRGSRGLRVVRLKGGDPYVFGRGGEEVAALREAGVPHEVVPGLSAAIAAPAAAGVPVTLRNEALSFTVVTGHEHPDSDAVDWDALARTGGTLVILMGATRAGAIAERLRRAGLAPDTPVAVVHAATLPGEQTTATTLGELGRHELRPPCTIVVGSVARLAIPSPA
jgi:uroporphyrin-III C-methyltransferase